MVVTNRPFSHLYPDLVHLAIVSTRLAEAREGLRNKKTSWFKTHRLAYLDPCKMWVHCAGVYSTKEGILTPIMIG